jgi:hypothetical protein
MTFSTLVNNGGIAEIKHHQPRNRLSTGRHCAIGVFGRQIGHVGYFGKPCFQPVRLAVASITAQGSGYTSATATFSAPTSGTTATGTPIISTGSVTSYTSLVGGSGYTTAPSVTFSGGAGSGAERLPWCQQVQVVSLTITNGGTGYLRTHDCIWRSRHRRISYSRHYGCG